ncbi:hypothetical protein SAMN05216226_11250 [Halovenus aranensis]|uniref:Ig-like domain-containing protein n=1 Tax=Halovenus aranensis TaxID=890420 RepID=A0A1G8XRS3_9EURY|nr:hypothetical protein [Halovenus aranensis]SDJ93382.1 hypothetical protein SAMN05216226_11250 [Halovenus aranensis]
MLQSAQPSADTTTEEADRRVARRSEELHLRNFDLNREYTLTVQVSDGDGLVFANRYYLTPGKTVSELGRIPPGEYEVRVELDGRRQQTATCEIDRTPRETALVEVGNGTVSLTQGLYR